MPPAKGSARTPLGPMVFIFIPGTELAMCVFWVHPNQIGMRYWVKCFSLSFSSYFRVFKQICVCATTTEELFLVCGLWFWVRYCLTFFIATLQWFWVGAVCVSVWPGAVGNPLADNITWDRYCLCSLNLLILMAIFPSWSPRICQSLSCQGHLYD